MKVFRIIIIAMVALIPLVSAGFAVATEDIREGKIEWFIDDVERLNSAEDYRPDIASVWPGEKIPDGGYLLPGSMLTLHYKSAFYKNLSMLTYSPDGQIIPLFINKYMHMIPTKSPINKYKFNVPPVQGRGGVILIASKRKLSREVIAQVAKNPDAETYPPDVESVTFTHFIIVDYVNTVTPNVPYNRQTGYNTPDGGGHSQPPIRQTGSYNQPMYYYSGPNYGYAPSNIGPQGIHSIPISEMGSTYYFYPNGSVSENYYPPDYYNPYYHSRPMYYGTPGNMNYAPPGQRYYIIPSQDGIHTNLQDFVINANFDYGSFTFGEDGYLGGSFYFDGSNPSPDGLTFRFPAKSTWEHEGPDGHWIREVPNDFSFYLNGNQIPIQQGYGQNPYYSIPLTGFLMDGLNEFRLLPRSNQNIYGIGPIEISTDINW